MFYTFVFLSFFLLLPDREREGRVVGGTALYHLNTRRVVAAYSREFVGKIVEGKIAPRATFHFPAKCALLRPPTNNDFHRFDETFFLPSQTRFSSFPLLPLSLSLSHTPHPVNPRVHSDRLLFRFSRRNMFLLLLR